MILVTPSLYCFQIFLLTVVTRSGVCGAGVASHVVEELKLANVHAPNPRPQTVERAAADWDELKNHEYVANSAAQVYFRFHFLFV